MVRRSVLSRSTGLALSLIGCMLGSACRDVVVGYFPGTTGGPGSEGSTSAALPTGTGTTTAAGSDGSDGSGDGPFVGCYSDEFEADALDSDLWNSWTEKDSQIEQGQGLLEFTPPSTGVFDAGLVGHFDYRFAFEEGWLRIHIGTPPSRDRPVALFLMVQQGPDSMWINVGGGDVGINGSADETTIFSDDFPADPYPQWLGIRGEGSMVHFEISDDGQAWTTLASYEKPRVFDHAAALIMAQTYGDDATQQLVSIQRFEACVP